MTRKNFTSRDMRDALSSFATGVTIVTALDADKNPIGMTASSFNSVSMDPPLVLWSVTKEAMSAQAFHDASHFGVHILDITQTETSNLFARKGEDKFGKVDYQISDHGIPQIEGALTRFDCKTWAVYEGGDHWIIVGEVLELTTTKGEGLVFCQGSYARATPVFRAGGSQTTEGKSEVQGVDDLLLYRLSRAHHQISQEFYVKVRECKLSVPEWRVLASLHGRKTRALSELSAQTFVGYLPLQDLVLKMQDEGLCNVIGGGTKMKIIGTDEGHARVDHLFTYLRGREADLLPDPTGAEMDQLMGLLNQVIETTNA